MAKYCIAKFSGSNRELAEMLNRLQKPTKIIGDGLPNLDDPIDAKIWYNCQESGKYDYLNEHGEINNEEEI